ncbi:hypothetical protein ABER68_19125 [Paenibacillus alvei]
MTKQKNIYYVPNTNSNIKTAFSSNNKEEIHQAMGGNHKMPRDADNIHVETESHKDGPREGVIPSGNSNQMGIRTEAGHKKANAFHVQSLKADADMQQFSDTIDNAFPK